jgi:hypothetical protein
MLKHGEDPQAASPPYGHDILRLWNRAVQLGLSVPQPQPNWVQRIHGIHAQPHRARYLEDGVTLIVAFQARKVDVDTLTALVASAS